MGKSETINEKPPCHVIDRNTTWFRKKILFMVIIIFLICFRFSAVSPEPVIHLWDGIYGFCSYRHCYIWERHLYFPALYLEGMLVVGLTVWSCWRSYVEGGF